jgi:hypothetical protein
MAQSALTVTPPSPTPPTNMSFTGATGPNPPNYTKLSYAAPFGARNSDGTPTIVSPPGVSVNVNPPPYYDDGTAGALTAFAANTAALAGGTGATSGGTEGTYPGSGSGTPPPLSFLGAVPASTSVAHEGAGTEAITTAPGSRTECPTVYVGTGPAQTAATILAGPNASHASSLSPSAGTTLTSVANAVSGAGTTPCVATGTGFTRQSVLYVNGVAQTTTYTSPTSITAPTAPKKATAGTVPVYVITGGVVQSATVNWTFT